MRCQEKCGVTDGQSFLVVFAVDVTAVTTRYSPPAAPSNAKAAEVDTTAFETEE